LPAFAGAASALLIGKFSDIYGHRNILLVGVVPMTLSLVIIVTMPQIDIEIIG
jgi:MFS family permease